jgi:hypothetical protein
MSKKSKYLPITQKFVNLVEKCCFKEVSCGDEFGWESIPSPDGKWLLILYGQAEYPTMYTGLQVYNLRPKHVQKWHGQLLNSDQIEKAIDKPLHSSYLMILDYKSLCQYLWADFPEKFENESINPFIADFSWGYDYSNDLCETCYQGLHFNWDKHENDTIVVGNFHDSFQFVRINLKEPKMVINTLKFILPTSIVKIIIHDYMTTVENVANLDWNRKCVCQNQSESEDDL